MKSRDGKSQRREGKKKEDQKRESLRRKKIQVREKVGKSPNTVFFQWFVAPEGRIVGSLKRRVRSHVVRWEIKSCTPLWREAHFEVNMWKKLTMFGPLLEVAISNKCTPWWREAHFQVKTHKHTMFGPLLEVATSNKCTPLWREDARSTFPSQNVQNTPCSDHFGKLRCRKSARRCGAKHISKSKVQTNWRVRSTFGRSDAIPNGRRKSLCTLSKVSKTWGSCGISKNDGRRGTFKEDLQRCIFRGWRSTRDIFIRAVRRSGRWFPEKGYILEPQIFRFAEMILRDRCSTSYDLASFFRGRRNTLDRWSRKFAKRIGTRPSALHSTFHFWRKSRRIVSFLMLPTSKMRTSRRIVSFLTLSSSKIEEISQNSCVFKLADR